MRALQLPHTPQKQWSLSHPSDGIQINKYNYLQNLKCKDNTVKSFSPSAVTCGKQIGKWKEQLENLITEEQRKRWHCFTELANCQALLPYLKIQKQLLAPEDKRQNPNLCLLSMSVSTNVKFWPTWLTVRLRQRQNKGKNECAVSFLITYLITTSRWTCNTSFLSGTLYKWTENLHTSREQIVS